MKRFGFFNEKASIIAISVLLILLFPLFCSSLGWAHPGRTDAKGGHYNRKTGVYHFHGGAKSRPKVNVTPAPRKSGRTRVDASPVVVRGSTGKVSKQSELKLTTWNIRTLSGRSRDDAELRQIASILIDYDLIAISELHDETVLKRIQRILSKQGAEYGYLISDPIGRQGSSYREHYAFLYEKGLVSVVQDGTFYPDTDDGEDDFVCDAYWATFRAGKFDFSVIVVHVLWEDTIRGRQTEVMELAEVYKFVDRANGAEDDILLLGNFSREPDDTKAYSNLMALPSMTHLFDLPEKSHIRDSRLYNNIFFRKHAVTEYTGRFGIDKFDETEFGNDDTAANSAVSDHRPVWAVFRIDGLQGESPPITWRGSGAEVIRPPVPTQEAVYITRTGKKYHRGGCRYLRKSRSPISLTAAKRAYDPCLRCNPPR